MSNKEELQGCIYAKMNGDVDECFFTGKDCKPSTECILLLCKRLKELEKDNFQQNEHIAKLVDMV